VTLKIENIISKTLFQPPFKKKNTKLRYEWAKNKMEEEEETS
jgi:hypothetical protein